MDQRRGVALAVIAASLALPLAGCAAGEPSAQGTPSPTSSAADETVPPAPATTPVPQPTGSAGDLPQPPLPIPPGTNAKRVALKRSGGFAGALETLIVAPNGQWTYFGGRGTKGGGKPTTGQLNAAQFSQLQALLASPKLVQESRIKRGPAECRDGYSYELTTPDLTVSWQSCSPADDPATAAAIARLLTGATPM
ncbi:MAG TPA: hypothetical protein VFR67_17750 [Pilimelia sp.]|nr:hypothetical protein [Pilimelia sp.]